MRIFLVPSSKPVKKQWVNFIFSGIAQTTSQSFVWSKHFTDYWNKSIELPSNNFCV